MKLKSSKGILEPHLITLGAMELHQIQELEDNLVTRKTILYELYTLPGRIKNKKEASVRHYY